MIFTLTSQLKKLRLERGITQQQLSDLTGISVNQISFIENNKTYPTIYTLWRIAKILDCKVDDMYKEQI